MDGRDNARAAEDMYALRILQLLSLRWPALRLLFVPKGW